MLITLHELKGDQMCKVRFKMPESDHMHSALNVVRTILKVSPEINNNADDGAIIIIECIFNNILLSIQAIVEIETF